MTMSSMSATVYVGVYAMCFHLFCFFYIEWVLFYLPSLPSFLDFAQNHTPMTARAMSPARATNCTPYVATKSMTMSSMSETVYVALYAIVSPFDYLF